ncbi:MAG: hypothetical protein ACJ748_05695 [Flavisolibacter sp.]
MTQATLQFKSIADAATFVKGLDKGYILNTSNLTITSNLLPVEIEQAIILFNAMPVQNPIARRNLN